MASDPHLLHADRVLAACRMMIASGGPLDAASLAEDCHVSARQLARSFQLVLGITPREFGQAVRTGRARALLRASSSVTEALTSAGYRSVRAFYESVPPTLGMDPSAYLAGAPDHRLRWTARRSALGWIILVASDRGLCAIKIGPARRGLVDAVRAEFPHATLAEDADGLEPAAEAVLQLAQGLEATVGLPLDLRGTAFQARVWEALRRIPAGEVRTYADVAAAIGSPGAVRAVGTACGANPLAIIVPCHRVVRSDGSLGGYHWGLEVKRQLLDAERAPVSDPRQPGRRPGPGDPGGSC